MIHPVAPVLGSRCGRRLRDGQSEGQQQPGDLASRNALAVLFQSQVVQMASRVPVPVAAEVRNLQVIQNYVGASNCQQRSSPSSPSDATYSNAHVPKRSRSDFSIEAILARNPPLAITIPQQSSKEPIIQIDSNPVSAKHIQSETSPPHHQLSWVHCTRYRPPKLPRVKREITTFRTRYRNPRIPFSTAEVAALERKFRSSPYLGSHDVAELATNLNMSPKRIKIWFQNRRARERRENDIQ